MNFGVTEERMKPQLLCLADGMAAFTTTFPVLWTSFPGVPVVFLGSLMN
jgi:hypothetical protein